MIVARNGRRRPAQAPKSVSYSRTSIAFHVTVESRGAKRRAAGGGRGPCRPALGDQSAVSDNPV